jgi:CheY-like chemotaxis protein
MPHILIVEDEVVLSNIMRVRLEDEKYKVTLVENGQDALRVLEKDIPDVILLDLIMPDMDGFEFLKEIKNVPAYQNIPVIVSTNLNQEEDISRVKSMGVTDYVVKSDVTMTQLADKVTEIVKRKTTK